MDPWWARLLVAFGALLMVLSGVMLATANALISRYDKSVPQRDLLGSAGDAQGKKGAKLDGPLNILLVGLDARPGESMAQSRADTVIILHVTAAHDRAYLVSVPRDLMVQAKSFKKSRYGGGRAKMTETFFFGAQNGAGVAGGMELLALSIKQRLGITMNAAAVINFDSFSKVIDALGGVDMCFDERVVSKHLRIGPDGKVRNVENQDNPTGAIIVYPKGQCRHLRAWEALDYSRQRYGLENGDYDRQRHQQQLIKAMVKQATSIGVLTNPVKLDRVIRAAGAALVLDTRGVPLADFVFTLKGIGTNGLVMVRTNAGQVTSENVDGISFEVLSPASEELFKAVQKDRVEAFVAAHPDYVVT